MTGVSWLDDDEQRAWRAYIAAQRHYRAEVEMPLFAESGFTNMDYAVLVHLSEVPDRQARMAELAEIAGVSSSQLVYRIDRLVGRGLIERRPVPGDRRGSLAVLTEQGFAELERAAVTHVKAVRAAFIDRLTRDEFLELGDLLRKAVGD